jgi:muramoyltetrapeptide carboxypeptidase
MTRSHSYSKLKKIPQIQIIAPASSTPVEKLEKSLLWLDKNDFTYHCPQDLQEPTAFFANSLSKQIKHFQAALKSRSPFLWGLRGGYGSARLIETLNEMPIPSHKPLFIGYSDLTALHLYIHKYWKLPTLHAKMISELGSSENQEDLHLLKELLQGKKTSFTYTQLRPLNQAAKKVTSLDGKILGGNLKLLSHSIGTDYQIRTHKNFLFLEDVGERGYALHRMLLHLEQASVINKNIKAVFLGHFTEGLEPDGSDKKMLALSLYAESSKVPFFYGLPVGHSSTQNYPLPLNTPSKLRKVSASEYHLEVKAP